MTHKEHTMTDTNIPGVHATLIHNGDRITPRWRMTILSEAYLGAGTYLPADRSPWYPIATASADGRAWLAERGFRIVGTGDVITGGYRYGLATVPA